MNFKKSTARIILFLAMMLSSTSGQQNPPDSVKKNSLNVTVTDRDEQVVTDLKAADFTVYEDDQPRQVISASLSDTPACLGIALDNSGSMPRIRSTVIGAIYNFVKASNPDDETFLVNFNDDAYLDQDFTKDPNLIREALNRADSRGPTALYDAVISSTDHLAKRSSCVKRILLVLTDGQDNTSSQNLKQTVAAVQRSSGVIVYAIGLSGELGTARHALEVLTLQTGGAAFFVHNIKDTNQVLLSVAEQIRNQYSITYIQDNPSGSAKRKITIKVNATGRSDLVVRMIGKQP